MVEPSDTRSRILSVASELYAKEGLSGLSMRKVAEKVGLTATAIYRHFEDKEALLQALGAEGFRLFGSYLWEALGEGTPEARLVRTGERYLRFALEQSRYYEVIFISPASELGLERLPQQNRERLGSSFQFLVDRVKECMAAGVLAPAEPLDVAVSIWAHVHGLVSLRLMGHLGKVEESQFEALFHRSVARLLAGLR
jgi:AcrR family transcriptional regulator